MPGAFHENILNCASYGLKTCSTCIVELFECAGFLGTRETSEALAAGIARLFLKSPKCLYNSPIHEEQVFSFPL